MKGRFLLLMLVSTLSANMVLAETVTIHIHLRPLSEFQRDKEGNYLDTREDTGYLSFRFVHTEADSSLGEEYFTVWVKPFLTPNGEIREGNGGHTYIFGKKTVFSGSIKRAMLRGAEGKRVRVSAKIAHIPAVNDSLNIVKSVAYELRIDPLKAEKR